MKYKPNKFAEQRRDRFFKKEVEEEITYEVQHDVNIDEDKKELLDNNKEGEL
jgi:hypothetical protein